MFYLSGPDYLFTMLHTRLSLLLTLTATLIAYRRCGAFNFRTSHPQTGTGRILEMPASIIAIKTSNGFGARIGVPQPTFCLYMAKLPTSNDGNKARKYTSPEDGSPLGVAVVVLGFVALQVFGDKLDSEVVEQYAAPIILCSASIAAGISRLVRNSDGWKKKKNREGQRKT